MVLKIIVGSIDLETQSLLFLGNFGILFFFFFLRTSRDRSIESLFTRRFLRDRAGYTVTRGRRMSRVTSRKMARLSSFFFVTASNKFRASHCSELDYIPTCSMSFFFVSNPSSLRNYRDKQESSFKILIDHEERGRIPKTRDLISQKLKNNSNHFRLL